MARRQPAAREEGTEGASGGEAALAANGNGHVSYDPRRLLAALKTLKKGDFGVRLPVEETVVGAAIAEAFNDVADLLEHEHPGDRADRHGRRQGGPDHPAGQRSGPPPGRGRTGSTR